MTLRARTSVLGFVLGFSALAQAQTSVLPLWPHGTPEPPQTTAPEVDATKPSDNLISGRRTQRLTNVTVPTLSVFQPRGHGNGAAALVFPGGGYRILAWDGEGLDTCHWLNSIGMTCLLVKYRVPEQGRYPDNPADLEDAQQAMRLARSHAAEWHIDPHRIGVVGFSAGANLAVLLSTHADDVHIDSTPAATPVDTKQDARANFAVLAYPAYLPVQPGETLLDPIYTPNALTPPTFLIQAGNDRSYSKNALVYYRALLDAKIPAELHYYATGGHGFGVYPVGVPEENWTELATRWLRNIGIIPALPGVASPVSSTGTATPINGPCPSTSQPPAPGKPAPSSSETNCF